MNRFRGGLVSKDHRLLYHSTLGVRVIKKKKKKISQFCVEYLVGRVYRLGFRVWGVRFGVEFRVSGSARTLFSI